MEGRYCRGLSGGELEEESSERDRDARSCSCFCLCAFSRGRRMTVRRRLPWAACGSGCRNLANRCQFHFGAGEVNAVRRLAWGLKRATRRIVLP